MGRETYDQIFAALAEDAVHDALLHTILRQAQYMDEREFWIQVVRILSRDRRKVMRMLDRCSANSTLPSWAINGKAVTEVDRPLVEALEIIRRASRNLEPTAQWMQRVAAWALEPHKWPRPETEPPGEPVDQPAKPAAIDEALLQRIVNMLQHGESVWAEPAYYDEILARLRLLSPGQPVTLERSIDSDGLVILQAVFQCSND
jgi:hypothetical protein